MSDHKSAITARLGSQAALIFAGNVFTLAVGLPLQIYVARNLGAEGLGVFSLIEGGVNLAVGLLAFGLAPTLVRFIPSHLEREEYGSVRRLLRACAQILILSGAVAYGALLILFPFALLAWPSLANHRTELAVMGLLIPLGLLFFLFQQGLRGFQEIRYMVVGSSFLQLAVKALMTVILVGAGFHILGYAWAVVASMAFAAAWMAVGVRRKVSSLPAEPVAKRADPIEEWRDYAKVMYGGSLLTVAGQYLDRFLLGALAGAGPVGVLMVVKQLQQLPVFFLQMFLSVASPMFSAAHARSDLREMEHIYHLTTDWVARLSAPLFIFLFLFADPLLGLFGAHFAADGAQALWILLAGQAVNLAFGPVGTLANMWGLEAAMFRLNLYQSIVSLVLMIVLVPGYGLSGAAVALAAGLVLLNVATLALARTKLGLRWADKRFARWAIPIAATVVAALILKAYGPGAPDGFLLIVFALGLYAVFVLASIAQGLHADDRDLLRHLYGRLFRNRTP